MNYFLLDAAGNVEAVRDDEEMRNMCAEARREWRSRWDWHKMPDAMAYCEKLAAGATAVTGRLYIASDLGPCVSPRFDVVEAPRVGDAISRSFNGDSYPDGHIVAVSDSLRVITSSSGRKYYKQGARASWKLAKSCFYMIAGHVSEYNREL